MHTSQFTPVLTFLKNWQFLKFISFIIPICFFSSILLMHRDYIPLWDSRWYFSTCILPAASQPFSWLTLNCSNHDALFFGFLYSILQKIDYGNVAFIHLTTFVFSLIAFSFFYRILNDLFKKPWWIALGMAMVCCNPAVIANMLNPTPDLIVFGLSIICLWYFLTHQLRYAACLGLLLVFSKEAGVLFYALACGFYCMIFYSQQSLKESLKLLWPFIIYALFLGYKIQFSSEDLIFLNMPATGLLHNLYQSVNAKFIANLSLVLILNFQWLTTFIIVFGALINIKNSLPSKEIIFIGLLAISLCYILPRFAPFANVRYFLLIFPLTSLLFIATLKNFKKITAIVLSSTLILGLLISCFRTVDLLSVFIFGTFSFGNHQLLNIPSMAGECCGFGRDQLIYNLEHTQYHTLLNKFSRLVSLANKDVLISDPLAGFSIYANIDNSDYSWTFKKHNTHTPIFSADPNLLKLAFARTVNHIYLPNYSNVGDDFATKALQLFKPISIIHVENAGYKLDVAMLQ